MIGDWYYTCLFIPSSEWPGIDIDEQLKASWVAQFDQPQCPLSTVRDMKLPHPSSVFLRQSALVRMYFWACNVIVVILAFTFARKTWDKVSVLYLVIVSLYANFATDFTNWQAARVEVKQDVISGEVEVDVETTGPTEITKPA